MPLRLVLGLGNPGEEYRETRHNAGFRVVDELARRWGATLAAERCRTLYFPPAGDRPALAQPLTYMNRSGHAARCLVELDALDPSDLLVVYDDVHLPFGRLRLRPSGGPGGHRGLESIVENLRTTAIPRLRLGVAPKPASEETSVEPGIDPLAGEDLAPYVLAPFDPEEREPALEMIRRAADACELMLDQGIEAAMNRWNG